MNKTLLCLFVFLTLGVIGFNQVEAGHHHRSSVQFSFGTFFNTPSYYAARPVVVAQPVYTQQVIVQPYGYYQPVVMPYYAPAPTYVYTAPAYPTVRNHFGISFGRSCCR